MVNLHPQFWDRLAWSFSKHNLRKECARQYWYEYIGPNDSDVAVSERNRLLDLKKLRSKKFITGGLVHDALASYITHIQQGYATTEQEMHDSVLSAVSNLREFPEMLTETVNGLPPDEGFYDRVFDTSVDQISVFLRLIWPKFASMGYLEHEQFGSTRVGNASIIVKADLVVQPGLREVRVVDWKTGSEREGYETNLQLSAYTLWSMSKYSSISDKFSVSVCRLSSGHIMESTPTKEDIERTIGKIADDWHHMTNDLTFESHPASPSPSLCISCKFATVCSAADLRLRT